MNQIHRLESLSSAPIKDSVVRLIRLLLVSSVSFQPLLSSIADIRPAIAETQTNPESDPTAETPAVNSTVSSSVRVEIDSILKDQSNQIDDQLRQFLQHVDVIARSSILTQPQPELNYNFDTLPREWASFIWVYAAPLEIIGINLQSLTRDGVFYFDLRTVDEVDSVATLNELYSFPADAVLKTKPINRKNVLVGLSLSDLKKNNSSLEQWLDERIDVDASFQQFSHGTYYKLIDGTIQSHLPKDLKELEAVIPLTDEYDRSGMNKMRLVQQQQPVEILYQGSVPLYFAVEHSQQSRDVYWNDDEQKYYVFEAGETPDAGTAFLIDNYPILTESLSSDADRSDKEALPTTVRCTEAGYICTDSGEQVVNWATKSPVQLINGQVYESVGQVKRRLGLYDGLHRLGFLGVMQDGKYLSLQSIENQNNPRPQMVDQLESTANWLLAEVFQVGQFSESQLEAAEALGQIVPDTTNISTDLLLALISTEDKRFILNGEKNYFIDAKAVARAVFQNLDGKQNSGASTLHLQTAKSFFKPFSRAQQQQLDRKLEDMHDAAVLSRYLTPEQVIRLYLELLHKHGFSYLSQQWFGKDPEQLGLMEASLLAGYPQSPSQYNPASIDNVTRWLDRQQTVLALLKENQLKTEQELLAAQQAAQQLLLPTPSETIPWILQQLPGFNAQAAEKLNYAIGDNFIANLRDAHLISQEDYQSLIQAYYQRLVWQQKLENQPTDSHLAVREYRVSRAANSLEVSDIPYHLFGTPIEKVKDSQGAIVETSTGHSLWWNPEDYRYYELTSDGRFIQSELLVIQDAETNTYVTIGEYLPATVQVLVDATFDVEQLRRGSDGFAYSQMSDGTWKQIGQILEHHGSRTELVIQLNSSEVQSLKAFPHSQSPAFAALESALSAKQGKTEQQFSEQLLLKKIMQDQYMGVDPNKGAVLKDDRYLLYPAVIEEMMKTLGNPGTAIETTDETVLMDSIRKVLETDGTAIVFLGNEFKRPMPFYNLGTADNMQLEVVPDNYQTVVVRQVVDTLNSDGSKQTWVVYADPTRSIDATGAAATMVATQEEFVAMSRQFGRSMLWTDQELSIPEDARYSYQSAASQSALFWSSNGIGIATPDGQEIDRTAFIKEFTTIDVESNQQALEVLRVAVKNRSASAGSVVIMNARTGEVKVMASVDKNGQETTTNYAAFPYFSGSVAKPITVLAASTAGVDVTKQFAAGDRYQFVGSPYGVNNWTTGEQALMTALQAVARSNNPAFTAIGIETIRAANDLNYFGTFYQRFVEASPVTGLPTTPQVVIEENTSEGPAAMQSFGQRMQLSLLEIAQWYSAIALNGQIVPAQLSINGEKQPVTSLQALYGEQITPGITTAQTALKRVVLPAGDGFLSGTAPYFGQELKKQGYTFAAKTGTGEDGGYRVSNATFAGWIEDPASNDIFVFGVSLLNGGEGSRHAAPVAEEILTQFMRAQQEKLQTTDTANRTSLPSTDNNSGDDQLSSSENQPPLIGQSVHNIDLSSWDSVGALYFSQASDGTVLFGSSQELAQKILFINQIAYVTDANAHGAYLVINNSGYVHIILDLESATIPGALQNQYPTVEDLRQAYLAGFAD